MKILVCATADTSIKYFLEKHFQYFMMDKGHNVYFWPNVNEEVFDICIFTDFNGDIKNLKTIYPGAKYVLVDPKMNNKKQIKNAKLSDLVVVSSIEQFEFANQFNKNVKIHHWYRYIENRSVEFSKINDNKNDVIEILYHGNKIHLEAIGNTLKPALERLNRIHNIEFTVVYNIKNLGKWTKSVPKNVKINHVQWSEDNYLNVISKSDIGVIPNFIPESRLQISYYLSKLYLMLRFLRTMNINKNDYKLRFKHNSNPGRLYEFAITQTPVVAEATLSLAQEIEHGTSGYLVISESGWYSALNELILNQQLRRDFGQKLFTRFGERHDIHNSLQIFESNLQELVVRDL
jgi:glycosyltransferase involved in cell wall biosynthesis